MTAKSFVDSVLLHVLHMLNVLNVLLLLWMTLVFFQVLTVVRHKGLWFVVSMGCYMTGVGGMVFCIIRNPKPHGYHQVQTSRLTVL